MCGGFGRQLWYKITGFPAFRRSRRTQKRTKETRQRERETRRRRQQGARPRTGNGHGSCQMFSASCIERKSQPKKETKRFFSGCGSGAGGGMCGVCESMKVKFTHATVETSRVPHHLVAVRNGRGEGGRTVDQVGQLFLADFVAVIFDRIFVVLVFDEVRDTSSQSAIVRIICRKSNIMSN